MSKTIDLTGRRFGRLIVVQRADNKGKHVRYLCLCDCGVEKIFYATNLIRGLSTSCGCLRKEKSRERQFIDLTGQRFGHLMVLGLDHYNVKTQQYYWKCVCDCGGQCVVYGGHLKSGHTSSCGCYNKQRITESNLNDLTGQKFGKLIVIKRIGTHYTPSGVSSPIWLCQCDCGNQTEVMSVALRNGTSSCGCVVSMGEDLISSILRDNKIDFKKQYSFDDLYTAKQRKLYFDFGILNNGKLQCLIEYQGRQHFFYDENWKQTREDFEEGQERDAMKRRYCQEKNIKLIEIPYWDFSKIDWNYIKERIGDK